MTFEEWLSEIENYGKSALVAVLTIVREAYIARRVAPILNGSPRSKQNRSLQRPTESITNHQKVLLMLREPLREWP
jgi:hypothetical protein